MPSVHDLWNRSSSAPDDRATRLGGCRLLRRALSDGWHPLLVVVKVFPILADIGVVWALCAIGEGSSANGQPSSRWAHLCASGCQGQSSPRRSTPDCVRPAAPRRATLAMTW